VFLVSICASLAGHPPRDGTAACEASAIFVESATWVQYLLAITVAAVSYTLLLHPLSRVTLLLERYWILIVVLVCSVSVGIATLQASLYTAVYVGGFCWNVSFFLPFPCDSAFLNGAASQGSTGNTFNELLNFIPRAIVFLIILAIYGRIHWFLRRKGTTTMSGSMPPALTTCPTRAVAEDSQPWEKLYLSGLSGIVAPGDSHRSGPQSISPCQLSRTPTPTPLNVDAIAGMRPGVANTDCAKAICNEPGFIAPVPPPVAMSFVPSDSLTVISAPDGGARPLSSCRDPYATGVGHSPYPGPLPVARRRAKQEHFEALQVLLTRKAAMLFLLFPLTVWILCSR